MRKSKKTELLPITDKENNQDKNCQLAEVVNKENEPTSQDFFKEFARIIKRPEKDILDECYFYQIRKIMASVGKVIVRYSVNDSEMEEILHNSNRLNIEEILLSPTYINSLAKKVKKNNLQCQKVSALIDFPFGESLFKSKLTDVKLCRKMGVDEVTVMFSSSDLLKENQRKLKKKVKKLANVCNGECGLAISVEELDDELIKNAIKIVSKSKMKFIEFVFGEIERKAFLERVSYIAENKEKKQIKVLANISTIDGIIEVINRGVDVVLTPFADRIGKDLVEYFKVKSAKLK